MCYLSKLDGLEFKLLNVVYKKYFKSFWRIKDDLYFEAYISMLEYEKDNINYQEKDLIKCVYSSMGKLAYKKFNTEFTSISLEKENEKGSLLGDTISSLVGTIDSLNYKYLLMCFNNFIKTYEDVDVKNIYLDYYNGIALNHLRDKYKLNNLSLIKAIRTFRKDFEKYLISVGYLSNSIYKEDEFTVKGITSNISHRHYQKVNNQFIDLSSYSNDLLVYKLLRQSKDLIAYSQCIGLSPSLLNEIINHIKASKNKKLSLYQIQKLRVNYFADYTLEQLVSKNIGT